MDIRKYLGKEFTESILQEATAEAVINANISELDNYERLIIFHLLDWAIVELNRIKQTKGGWFEDEIDRLHQTAGPLMERIGNIILEELREKYRRWLFSTGILTQDSAGVLLHWAFIIERRGEGVIDAYVDDMDGMLMCSANFRIPSTKFHYELMTAVKEITDHTIPVAGQRGSSQHYKFHYDGNSITAEGKLKITKYVKMLLNHHGKQLWKPYLNYLRHNFYPPGADFDQMKMFREITKESVEAAICDAIDRKMYKDVLDFFGMKVNVSKPSMRAQTPTLSAVLAAYGNYMMRPYKDLPDMAASISLVLNVAHTTEKMASHIGVESGELHHISNLKLPENPTPEIILKVLKEWRSFVDRSFRIDWVDSGEWR